MVTLGGVRPPEDIKSFIGRLVGDWDKYGFGWWSARDLATGQFAGRGGPRHVLVEGRDEVEVGYGFMPEFWGRGFATELARESKYASVSANCVCRIWFPSRKRPILRHAG